MRTLTLAGLLALGAVGPGVAQDEPGEARVRLAREELRAMRAEEELENKAALKESLAQAQSEAAARSPGY